MSKYGPANARVQWFQDNYPGAAMDPNAVVVHTTEGTSWPGYSGGATAPNYTARPAIAHRRLDWRQHYPDERSARALENDPGGVETNTLNVVQVELVGTCDPRHRDRWGSARAGVDYIYWPEAPQWALRELAKFLAYMHTRHGVRLAAPRFKAYPASYGTGNGVRMTQRQWRNFYGVCGHQHVPENVHGDPGDLAMDKVLAMARAIVDPKPAKPAPKSRGANIDAALERIDGALSYAERKHIKRRARILRAARAELVKIKAH